MSITVNTKAYSLDTTQTPDSNLYTGPNHTFANKDTLVLKRTAPKATATFPGVARSTAKFTRSVTVGTEKYDAIIEVNCSLPSGMAKADVDSLRDDIGDLINSTNGDDLAWKHDINQ